MLRNLNKSSGGRRILGVPTVGILASTIAANTATGDNGPGLLYDDSLLAGNAGKQLRCMITGYTGTLSKLFVYEDGSFTLTGEADGSFTISYSVYADNAFVKTDTASATVGTVNASALAGTGTSTGSGSGGTVTAGSGSGATATSGTGISTGSGSGGEATGASAGSGSATDGTGTSTGTGSGGSASAGSGPDANTSSGTGTSTGSGSGGNAYGGIQVTQLSVDIIKQWCRIDGNEYDQILALNISAAIALASHETGVDYTVNPIPASVQQWIAAHCAYWIDNPGLATGRDLQVLPYVSRLLDPYRQYSGAV